MKNVSAIWGSRLKDNREERCEGSINGISFLREGFFCQLGEERSEKS